MQRPEEHRTGQGPRPQGEGATRPEDISHLSTAELVARIAQDAQNLVKAEIQLAKSELREDVKGAVSTVKRLGAAAGFGVAAVSMLLVTVVLALSEIMPAWAAALVVTVALTAATVVVLRLASRARPHGALERTRRNLKEDLHWSQRERTA